MNWFLYLVIQEFTDEGGELHSAGSRGTGRCSMAPGIMEAPYGLMYVVPESFIDTYHIDRGQRRYCASLIADAVSSYYGVTL